MNPKIGKPSFGYKSLSKSGSKLLMIIKDNYNDILIILRGGVNKSNLFGN